MCSDKRQILQAVLRTEHCHIFSPALIMLPFLSKFFFME
jgi:hypothetical protein